MASAFSGQAGLRPLPTSSTSARTVKSYTAASALKVDERRTMKDSATAGIDVLKVTKYGKLQPRRIALSPDNRSIYVTTNRIKSFRGLMNRGKGMEATARGIDVSTIDRIHKGQVTKRFDFACTEEPLVAKEDTKSLSIVYRVSSDASLIEGLAGPKQKFPNRFETLDLVVPKESDYTTLISVLEDLLALWQQEKRRYDHDLLLMQYHWIDMGKELSHTLTAGEWNTLAEKMNMPLKKAHLNHFYRDYLKDLSVEDLTLNEAGELVDDMRAASLHVIGMQPEDDPLTRVWNDICNTDPVPTSKMGATNKGDHLELEIEGEEPEQSVSAVAFLSFVRSNQKEYKTQLEHVIENFGVLNKQITLEDGADHLDDANLQRINKSRFLSYMLSDTNDIMDPHKGSMAQNKMFQPLSHYWINTSHDTFLAKMSSSFSKDGGENYYDLDLHSYQMALYRGVRCLELVAWDGETINEPVVGRRPETDGDHLHAAIPISKILRLVRGFLESNPDSFPVILSIENHCSLKFQEIMAIKLTDILAAANLLYVPRSSELLNSNKPLPTPENLRGLVVIKGKRPKDIKEGATILNDDFDDENDVILEEEEDANETEMDEKVGFVVGFNSSGPILSNEGGEYERHPRDLLIAAEQDQREATVEMRKAKARADELLKDASQAEALAAKLMGDLDVTPEELKEKGVLISPSEREAPGEGTEVDLESFTKQKKDAEGLEVQEFFANTVTSAKWSFTEADAGALDAAERCAEALQKLTKCKAELSDAEVALEESHIMAAKTSEAARRAAAEARANREHADTARQRVETVRELLTNYKESASSAETVVVTAMAEAKISEQRASELETRAARALATADKDRGRADAETQKEEKLEKEAAVCNDKCFEAKQAAKDAQERLGKAMAMLDRVNEQIKLIETSTQYQRETQEAEEQKLAELESGPRHASRFIAKHAAKLEERRVCETLIKEAKADSVTAEIEYEGAQAAYNEKARQWKKQADVGMAARRKADRSSHTAEELAEHAEEEREAANLRHVAREKAKTGVEQRTTQRTSVAEQLAQAERASAEAASVAVESRKRAEQLATDAARAKDHTRERQNVEVKTRAKEEAAKAYELALGEKAKADAKVEDARRLLDTSSEVFSNAKREVVLDIQRANAERLAERTAAHAYDKALITRQQANQAKILADMAEENANEKIAAAKYASEYKLRMDKVSHVSTTLASQTLLHTSKHNSWSKSLTLPTTHTHNMSQRMLRGVKDSEWKKKCVDFTMNHLIRTFPSRKVGADMPSLNYDPVLQWEMGAQLVSMNSHCVDEKLLLNDGRFRENGSCGYVLKPEHLIDDTMEQVAETPEVWKFEVLSGVCLPKPESSAGRKHVSAVVGATSSVSPFVKVSLHDGSKKPMRSDSVFVTKSARRNGLNPVWNSGEFNFTVSSPSVAMVLFSVWEKRSDGCDDFIAAASVPVSCMREGYRSVALFDSMHTRCGPYAFASLFVKAQKMKAT